MWCVSNPAQSRYRVRMLVAAVLCILFAALAHLPASAWPYGRVVAVAESGLRSSEPDNVAIRRNKGIVGGILAGAHVAVDWIPSA